MFVAIGMIPQTKIVEELVELENGYIKPTQREKTDLVGLEFELPIVNRKKKPVDFQMIHNLTEAFVQAFSFHEICRDDEGHIYLATEPKTGDGISFDCSYNTLEFSFGAESDMNKLYERFVTYYSYIQKELEVYDHTLTGMGINPYHAINENVPVVSERYRLLFHHLSSYKKYGNAIPFHKHPNFGLFSCASQIQMDVEEKDLVETLNTFTKLEPLKALIFSNSVWGEHGELLCSRDQFWRNSLHGINRHNVDMYGLEFETVDEISNYIESMSLYCVERDGKYINFSPVPLAQYFASDTIIGEYFDKNAYRQITIHPEMSDLQYLRSFKFEDLTFRGTIEFRSVCEQPVSEIMTTAAFHAGLMENLHALTERLNQDQVIYHRGYNASELRRMFVKRELPNIFDWKQVSGLLLDILDLAKNGLKKRGYGEEKFLEPLYTRAENLLSPGREMLEGIEKGKTIDYYIEAYARL